MYGVTIVFALITINPQGHEIERHGKFADGKACEHAASIVEQSIHPLPRGHAVVCQRRAEVNALVSYTSKN
jgi:hypothetical protein